jgi:hypothetical protein
MNNWAEEINSRIAVSLEKSRDKDLRFFRIDEFKRNIFRVGEFSATCSFCSKHKIDIAESVETIHEAVEVPGNSRREFDRLISRLSKHMQKEHGFYAPYYFSYWYSFIGISAGLLAGFGLYQIFPMNGEVVFSGCFIIGIITSYIAGSRKDNKIRKAKKLM